METAAHWERESPVRTKLRPGGFPDAPLLTPDIRVSCHACLDSKAAKPAGVADSRNSWPEQTSGARHGGLREEQEAQFTWEKERSGSQIWPMDQVPTTLGY